MLSYKQSGVVAKRLGSGLQNRLDRFDSGPRLQMKYQGHRFDGLIFLPMRGNLPAAGANSFADLFRQPQFSTQLPGQRIVVDQQRYQLHKAAQHRQLRTGKTDFLQFYVRSGIKSSDAKIDFPDPVFWVEIGALAFFTLI